MRKFKMKVIVQSKENLDDIPVTNQFSSSTYEDVSSVLPDLISFLNEIQKTNSSMKDFSTEVDKIPAFNLPHFERLNTSAVDVVNIGNNTSDDVSIVEPSNTQDLSTDVEIDDKVDTKTNDTSGFVIPADDDDESLFDPDEDTSFDF